MSRRAILIGTLAVFVVSFFAFAFLFLRMAMIYDSDSYYHLAVARLYGTEGVFAPNPWARFSILGNGADKDFLFHLLLVPFATLGDAPTGGRLALALFNAAIAAVIAWYAARGLGVAGFFAPLWLWIAAPPFLLRMVRLRPELLALLVILLALDAAANRRRVALALLAFAFALGYTAFHVFLFLIVLWCWRDWRTIAVGAGGLAAGLFLRPHPLANLQLWWVQNVEFFRYAGVLDVGDEIRAPGMKALIASLPFALALAAFWIAAAKPPLLKRQLTLPHSEAAIAALVFLLLFARFGRMATYFFPLAALAVFLRADDRARRFAPLILAASALAAIPFVRQLPFLDLLRNDVVTEADLDAFGRAVPNGAKVAATWGDGELYAFWAPQGRYLNVLEPLFMAHEYPRQYAAQRRLFAGLAPDPVAVLRRELDSDYIAFDRTSVPPLFLARMRSDPRFQPLYAGYNVLLRIVPTDVTYTDNECPTTASSTPSPSKTTPRSSSLSAPVSSASTLASRR